MAQSEDLPIFKASYDLLEQLTDLAKDLPKFFRYSIGQRMVDLCLDLLGNIYRANMKRDKAESLTDLLIDYRQLLLLLRVCYKQKALSTGRYAELVKLLDSIGRQATGWKNKVVNSEELLFAPEEMGGVSLEEVMEAYYDCRRNKRNTANQLRFEMDYERECIDLWQEINEHCYEPRRSIAFVVEKPVKREIFAADFRDRVVHHLIARRIMPLLEAKFHPESYSTQKGKGTLYGIQRIEKQLKACSEDYTRDCYIMKIDISGFFMSLSKQALYDCIRRFLTPHYPARDLPMLLYLLRKTIFNRPEKNCILKMPRSCWKGLPRNKSLFGTDGTCGIPIGNLTSQLLALLYLDDLDTLVTDEWGVPHYGRYVDDMVLIHPSKQHLMAVKDRIEAWLRVHGLTLHPRKTYVQHYAKGVLFIGGMILPGRKYMSRRTVGFMHEALEACKRLVGDNSNPPMEVRERVRATMNSYFGMLQHYDALRLTSSVIRSLPQEWFRWMYIVRRGHRCKMVVRVSV